MPLRFIRADLARVQVDAIVNTVSKRPIVGSGTDGHLNTVAGPELLAARKQIGYMHPGEEAVTLAFHLPAKYVIHTVAPHFLRDTQPEKLLRQCYLGALQAAVERGCQSIAFPLLATGYRSFPKELAFNIAVEAFTDFLAEHDLDISLVLFDKQSLAIPSPLLQDVQSFIDDHACGHLLAMERRRRQWRDENRNYCSEQLENLDHEDFQAMFELDDDLVAKDVGIAFNKAYSPKASLEDMVAHLDSGFSETLLKLIDASGHSDAEVYKKANMDRKLFSKIRNSKDYRPKMQTVMALAIALELDLPTTEDLLSRAGYALNPSKLFDVIVKYFIIHKNYDIVKIIEVLFEYDQQLLGYN